MKIAVAATTNDITADVAYDGGRAPFYLIFDEDGNLQDCVPNPFLELDRHAGYAVSEMLIDLRVDALVAGLFGPTVISELSSRGIRCIVKSGAAKDAVTGLML